MCSVCGCGQGEQRVEDLRLLLPHDHSRTLAASQAGSADAHPADDLHGDRDAAGGGLVPAGAYHSLDHEHWDNHVHTHGDGTTHAHPHNHAHGHFHERGSGVVPSAAARRLMLVEQNILARNDAIAMENRRAFQAARTLVLNVVSSPGSGKTTLLVETLKRIGSRYPVAVIEGDQETTADADRIRATGAPAIQVNTGKGCHLDAEQVRTATARLGIPASGILFIENVGNLVCPAGFDLGEAQKVVIVSVTEGEDKPLKYAPMFAVSALMVVAKSDLLPHLDFDVDRLIENARRINPAIGVLKLSAKSSDGMERWMHWLDAARAVRLAMD
ncbi:MAG TPA: hydrogenase nickel incorporation protein HypB [Acetobacteraceae bacterium]|jgi:hydrogenase nickel incorporation protein HypB|nr:hydrogenase nickel incorporation protein HypB [Acetobacteraceae bacterium]